MVLVTLGGKANLAVWEAKWPSTKIAPFSRVHLSWFCGVPIWTG